MCDKNTRERLSLHRSTFENGLRKKLILLILAYSIVIVFSELSFNPDALSAEQRWHEWLDWTLRFVVGVVFGSLARTWTRVALFSATVFVVQVIFVASFAYFDPEYLVTGNDLAKEFGISPNIFIVATTIYVLFPIFVGFCLGHVIAILFRKFKPARPVDL